MTQEGTADFLTLRDYALKLHFSERHVRRLLSQGKIEGGVKVGRKWLIPNPLASPLVKALKEGMLFTLAKEDGPLLELRKVTEPEPREGEIVSKLFLDLVEGRGFSVECIYMGNGRYRTLDSIVEEESEKARPPSGSQDKGAL